MFCYIKSSSAGFAYCLVFLVTIEKRLIPQKMMTITNKYSGELYAITSPNPKAMKVVTIK
jgi:hypothetical protein